MIWFVSQYGISFLSQDKQFRCCRWAWATVTADSPVTPGQTNQWFSQSLPEVTLAATSGYIKGGDWMWHNPHVPLSQKQKMKQIWFVQENSIRPFLKHLPNSIPVSPQSSLFFFAKKAPFLSQASSIACLVYSSVGTILWSTRRFFSASEVILSYQYVCVSFPMVHCHQVSTLKSHKQTKQTIQGSA